MALKEYISNYLFWELLQVALGAAKELSHIPSKEEWEKVYEEATRQAVLGVIFEGVQKLSSDFWPPFEMKFHWIGFCEQINLQNLLLNKRCVEVSEFFAKEGYRSCILKGQGNALMYRNPLSRTPGDIDIWVEGKRNDITEMVRKRFPNVKEQYHHIDFPLFDDIDVEVHYRPSWQITPIHNRRIQQYYLAHRNVQCNHVCKTLDEKGRICVPTRDFNLIFQLSHIMSHFFLGGIGLRQLIDYFYLLKHDFTELERKEYVENLKRFGMMKFAASVMWFMKEILGLEERYILVKPYERGGRLIYEEIMSTGNFGQYDSRIEKRYLNRLSTTCSIIAKNTRLACVYPIEALWGPIMLLSNKCFKNR